MADLLRMKVSIGNGGWLRIELPEAAGPLFVRVAKDQVGRWRIVDLYLAGDRSVTGEDLRTLPVAKIEAMAGEVAFSARIESKVRLAAIPLRTLASHFGHTFGPGVRTWVADAHRSQFPDSEVPAVVEAVHGPSETGPRPPLRAPQESRLTDAFLHDVARAYAAVVDAGEWPGPVLAKEACVKPATVHSWVAKARERGIMPPGRQGVVG